MEFRLSPERRDRALLLVTLVGIFALSACRDVRVLLAAWVGTALVFHRGVGRNLTRVVCSVVPVTLGLAAVSFAWLRLMSGVWPAWTPFVALAVRTMVIAFVSFSVLARVNLLRALSPYATLSRLLVVTLAQIHALRLLVRESLLGLKSRLLVRPSPLRVLRGASGITAAVFTLSTRNAQEISDAMRSRGF